MEESNRLLINWDYSHHEALYINKYDLSLDGWQTREEDIEVFNWIKELLCLTGIHQGNILELGCGAGNQTINLASLGFNVTGVDISKTAIKWAGEKKHPYKENVTFKNEDVTKLEEWCTQKYSIVIDSLCIHCIVGNDRKILFKNLFEVLYKGGYLFVITMCNEPKPKILLDNYDSHTCCIVMNNFATRYIGTDKSIVQEILESGFHIVYRRLVLGSVENSSQDMLLIIAQK